MKNLFFVLSLTFIFCCEKPLLAQEFEVPLHYKFENIGDYALYQQDVIHAIEWLENTPINLEKEKREEVNFFLFQWLSGSPSVSIDVHPYIVEISSNNPDLLMVFLGSWARSQMMGNEEKDALKLNVSGLNAVLKLYKLGGANKDKTVEKLIKIEAKGELEKWVLSKIS